MVHGSIRFAISMKLELSGNYNVSEVLFHNLEVGREDKTCLTVGHESTTYGELAGLAGRVGNALRSLARIDHRFGNEGDFGRPERFSESFAIDPVQVE